MASSGLRTAVSSAASRAFMTTCMLFAGRMCSPLVGSRAREMWPSRGDVAEAVLAGGLDDRLGDEQGNGLVAVGGERLQVAVVVVLVADQHAVKPGKVGNADGDRLALVVAGPGAEPRVGREGAP